MAKKSDSLPEGFDADESGGWLAEEDHLDRHTLWRLGAWGAGSVAAVIVAVMASQSSIGLRRDQIAAADLTRQSQQIASVARESQAEARRLASAIDTLNGDRDRLYSRVTVLEQGFDNVTGSIARQYLAAAAPQPTAAASGAAGTQPAQAPVSAAPPTMVAALTDKPREAPARQPESSAGSAAASPATPLMPAKSMMAPPDPAATKLVVPEQPPQVITATAETAAAEPDASRPAPETPAPRTEFGVDLGGASSVDGLRALWRGLLASDGPALSALRPIIVVKERNNGLGMQLRLVAGPLSDAAAAATICAGLMEGQHACETSVFDGQRLAMKSDDPPVARPAPRKRTAARRTANDGALPKSRPAALPSATGVQ
ncbi:MAG: hypothetical protein QOH32_659 [Bradyrhizobium sp.]|jgi:hypothetical protein|nr:hypothetical protein [Bradyrhizobium sp.]